MKKVLGYSDFSREEIENGAFGIVDSNEDIITLIQEEEKKGNKVKFETSIWRKIFCSGIYKIVVYGK